MTVLTKNRQDFFGHIENRKVILNKAGEIVKNEWRRTESLRERVSLGEWIIMPDHLHAVIGLGPVRAHCNAPLLDTGFKNKFGPQKDNLSSIIHGFKGACTKKIRTSVNPDFAWQRSFHDRIIRNDAELNRIEEYIYNNPVNRALKNNDFINFLS